MQDISSFAIAYGIVSVQIACTVPHSAQVCDDRSTNKNTEL